MELRSLPPANYICLMIFKMYTYIRTYTNIYYYGGESVEAEHPPNPLSVVDTGDLIFKYSHSLVSILHSCVWPCIWGWERMDQSNVVVSFWSKITDEGVVSRFALYDSRRCCSITKFNFISLPMTFAPNNGDTFKWVYISLGPFK